MNWFYALAGIVSAVLFVYLVVAMLKPEWFE
jgi:K+-transporting ATPase KdpF subunit